MGWSLSIEQRDVAIDLNQPAPGPVTNVLNLTHATLLILSADITTSDPSSLSAVVGSISTGWPFAGDRGFESSSLQRGVRCEPGFLSPTSSFPARRSRDVGHPQDWQQQMLFTRNTLSAAPPIGVHRGRRRFEQPEPRVMNEVRSWTTVVNSSLMLTAAWRSAPPAREIGSHRTLRWRKPDSNLRSLSENSCVLPAPRELGRARKLVCRHSFTAGPEVRIRLKDAAISGPRQSAPRGTALLYCHGTRQPDGA